MKKDKTKVKNELVQEKRELDEKIMKLNNFIRSTDFIIKIGGVQQNLMHEQSESMTKYSLCLRNRIVDIISQASD